ncbi:hypothetical protein H6F74_08215 [Trichocoleus sp. FACHB-90]|uniref:hypothetical protein n=1 Tax=Cyanophyceae TaxID=3028117 RepID=UPI001685EBED|nr:hypothetical protein [Trichocoleus sp. FACHB-90]MBD1926234.1 hypothetical protein [Trichocoleus sp. FACHB-90]
MQEIHLGFHEVDKMNDTVNVFCPVLLALILSFVWLGYNLGIFKSSIKINDEKGVLIPSLFLLVSPFLFTYLFSIKIYDHIPEIVRSILPVATFMLGQFITKREKRKEANKKEKELANMLLVIIDQAVIDFLYRLEGKLMCVTDGRESFDFIKTYYEKYKPEIDADYQKIRNQAEILTIHAGVESVFYIKRVRDSLEYMYSLEPTPQNILHTLIEIRSLKLAGYENILILIKEVINNDVLFNRVIAKLKSERKRFLQIRESHDLYLNYWINRGENEYRKRQEANPYLGYNINTESQAINHIEDTFKFFRITDYD